MAKKEPRKPQLAVPETPEPTPQQKARIARARERVQARPAPARFKLLSHENGQARLSSPHSDQEGFSYSLLDAFGTSSRAFADNQFAWLGCIVNSNQQRR